MLAAQCEDAKWLELLLEAGANVNGSFDNFLSPSTCVAWHGRSKCLEVLLQHGADVNRNRRERKSALMFAAERGEIECVKLLLKAGADVNAKEHGVYTALWFASINGFTHCAELLLKAGACGRILLRNIHVLLRGERRLLPLVLAAGASDLQPDLAKNSAFHKKLTHPDLQSQCRRAIRRHLLSVSKFNLLITIPKLSLPEPIKEFLFIEDVVLLRS